MLFSPDKSYVGGAELQYSFLADELNRRGYEVNIVTFLTSDPCQKKTPFFVNKKGMTICLIPKNNHSRIRLLANLRIIFNIWSTLRKFNADIYLQRSANFDSALVSLFCIFHRKKFIFNISSDGDLVDYQDLKKSFINKFISNFGISTADLVIAQSDEQKNLYRQRWTQNCCVIKSIRPSEQDQFIKSYPPIVLWVATLRELKHPEIFLKLARSIPYARFQMVGGPSDNILFYQKIQDESKEIPNLEFFGFIPETGNYFSKASILVNTSSVEGFPNTFLEAWSSRMPVVSLEIDPDEVICKNNLGYHSKTFDQMVKDVETLLLNAALRNQMGQNGQSYVKREHDVIKNVDRFITYVGDLFQGGIQLKSICIFNLYIGEILFNLDKNPVGGAELQYSFLADELNRRGYEVNIVTFATSGLSQKKTPFFVNKEGMTICLIPKNNLIRIKLLANLRTIFNIWSAMRKVNADIYLQGGANFETALVSLFCILHRKKFVAKMESVGDLVDFPQLRKTFINRFFSNFGISTADLVIALSDQQKEIYNEKWTRKCDVIKNIYPSKQDQFIKTYPPVVLWVATLHELKQPGIFLKLAKAIPHARFQMVGGSSKNIVFYQKIQEESKEIPNLEFVGFVPFIEIGKYFSKASIFVNTSSVEGFPNTFIEAWLSCMPVVSLEIDPDEVICKNNLGYHSKTFDQMVKDVEALLLNAVLRDQMGQNGQSYVKREHDVIKNVDLFIESISKLF